MNVIIFHISSYFVRESFINLAQKGGSEIIHFIFECILNLNTDYLVAEEMYSILLLHTCGLAL